MKTLQDVSNVPSKDLFNKVVREDINLMEPNKELIIPTGNLHLMIILNQYSLIRVVQRHTQIEEIYFII